MKNLKKQMQKKLQSKSGFTLVELIVVLVIMGILTAALVPTVTGYIGDAQDKVDASNLRMAKQAALLYLTDWEINGKDVSDIPEDFTVQDLITAGYLSGADESLASQKITYDDGENGKYIVIIGTS